MTIAKGAVSAIRIVSHAALTREDLELLRQPRAKTTEPERFRDAHHQVARLTAFGLSQAELSDRCGYSITRIQQLQGSPAFQQLVAVYRARVNDKFDAEADEYIKLATSNMMKAQRTIAEHFDKADEENELVPIRCALAVAADSADRLGYSRRQTNVNVNVDFAAQLESAIRRSASVRSADIIDIPARPVASGPSVPARLSADTSLSPPSQERPLRRRFG